MRSSRQMTGSLRRTGMRESIRRVVMTVWLFLVMALILSGCGESTEVSKTTPESVIQQGTLQGYERQTVGDAFGSFFANPSWSHTENEDGTVKDVTFTGVMQLDGKAVTDEIIFKFDKDDLSEFHVESIRVGDSTITTEDDQNALLDLIYGKTDKAELAGLKTTPEEAIQKSELQGYEGQTVGDAFSSFFTDPSWSHTENEDGTVKEVTFTGGAQLNGEDVTVEVVFRFDKDDWSDFHVESISIGDQQIVTEDDVNAFLDVVYGKTDVANLQNLIGGESTTEETTEETTEAETTGDTAADEDAYILPESDSRYYDYDEVCDMSVDELNLAIDEIYARHGRKFKTQEIQDYFDAQSWYIPGYDPDDFDAISDDLLNDYEKENVKTLSQARSDQQEAEASEQSGTRFTDDELASMAYNYYVSQYPGAIKTPSFYNVADTEEPNVRLVELGFAQDEYDIHYYIDATTGQGNDIDNGTQVDFTQYQD